MLLFEDCIGTRFDEPSWACIHYRFNTNYDAAHDSVKKFKMWMMAKYAKGILLLTSNISFSKQSLTR